MGDRRGAVSTAGGAECLRGQQTGCWAPLCLFGTSFNVLGLFPHFATRARRGRALLLTVQFNVPDKPCAELIFPGIQCSLLFMAR